nr:immunoglobulin light chain junction region [Macaca mulatta]
DYYCVIWHSSASGLF